MSSKNTSSNGNEQSNAKLSVLCHIPERKPLVLDFNQKEVTCGDLKTRVRKTTGDSFHCHYRCFVDTVFNGTAAERELDDDDKLAFDLDGKAVCRIEKIHEVSTLALSSSSFDPAIRVKCREEYVSEAIQIFNEFKQKALESKEKKTIQEFIGENIETYDKIEEFQELVFNDQLPKNLRKFKDQHQLLEPERNNSTLADQYNLPALLLHNLDQLDDQAKEKSKKIYEEVLKSEKYPNLAFLIGPSGSGKTRTALEFLTSYFGLFFTANTISNGGSLDLEDLLRSNSQGGSSSMSVLLEFLNLVFTRVAFLNGLRKKYKEKFKPWHWMVIQEMPRSIFGGKDVFIDIASNFKSMHVIDLVINNTSASSLLELTNEPSQLFVIFIDESQDLLANSNHCSASFLQDLISAIRSKHKPLVKTYDSNKPLLNSLYNSDNGQPSTCSLF